VDITRQMISHHKCAELCSVSDSRLSMLSDVKKMNPFDLSDRFTPMRRKMALEGISGLNWWVRGNLFNLLQRLCHPSRARVLEPNVRGHGDCCNMLELWHIQSDCEIVKSSEWEITRRLTVSARHDKVTPDWHFWDLSLICQKNVPGIFH
jgi:hypothetical protein